MRGVYEIHEWRNALNELRGLVRSFNSINADVLGQLEFSYRPLKDKKVQHCFLYCALYPEDFAISKDELIGYWIAEGLIEEVKNVQDKYDRGRLERVPSLAKLLALQCLDLEYTAVKEVPEGMEMLENLVHPTLYSKMLIKFPAVYNGSVANTRFYSFLRTREANKSVCFYGCKIYEREGVTIVLPKDVTSLIDVLSKEQGLVNAARFSHLKALWFSYCPNLQKLFLLQLLPALQNLEFLVVQSCKRIEEIVEVNDEETQKELGTSAITITLPRLKKLWLSFLPELKSVCSDNAVLICISLQEIQITPFCPKLKWLSLRLPLLDNGQPSPPPALEVIKIRKELWESLEWDQANAKEVLNPYGKFEQS
ncbi:hypothetical protein WN944_022609 [Citrus x changshan-huyou]|uniref:Disease resistance protein At4g27190-like leucine-rich repeats domain-containing protein n=1 Tax=Citrus x changshan-huyou TaxID=2935761 RepID=A0AAP0MYQ0_9ROSI